MDSGVRTWVNYKPFEIFDSKLLTISFANDFFHLFGEKLNVGCRKCLEASYKRMINFNFKEMKKDNDCEYLLKSKYEGIFWKGNPIRNGDLTDKVAKDLLKNHKAGKDLFEKIPVEKAKPKSKKIEK